MKEMKMKNIKVNSMITLKPMKVLSVHSETEFLQVLLDEETGVEAAVHVSLVDKVEPPEIDWDEIKQWDPLKFEGKVIYFIAKNNYAPNTSKDDGFAIVSSTFHAAITSEIFIIPREQLSYA